MAATDQTYRNQRILDIVFAVSCVLMLLSVLWMFWQDYHREFKGVQRDFRDVEEALSERQMLEALPEKSAVDERRQAVAEARKNLQNAQDEIRTTERDITVRRDLQDNEYRMI